MNVSYERTNLKEQRELFILHSSKKIQAVVNSVWLLIFKKYFVYLIGRSRYRSPRYRHLETVWINFRPYIPFYGGISYSERNLTNKKLKQENNVR